MTTLLSIVIPTYNRSSQLSHSLSLFAEQLTALETRDIDIIVVDDCSTDATENIGREYASKYQYISYIKNNRNIGLEANLIRSAKCATGKYVWIFGDDDYLEEKNSIEKILYVLRKDSYDEIIINRTRRGKQSENIISDDWMGIKGQKDRQYTGLSEFIMEWGVISVIGFVSVCIMNKRLFMEKEDEGFYGTMYPQLGMMLAAFHDKPVYLITAPLVCHRTLTPAEKGREFKNKNKEKTFMTDVYRRNAEYFGAPWVRMLNILVINECLSYDTLSTIRENTVIQGKLVDFLLNNIVNAVDSGISFAKDDQKHINEFFGHVGLTAAQVHRLKRYQFMTHERFSIGGRCDQKRPTISVVTPSYNQAAYLLECLDSVFEQTYAPIEHLVFDPGSTDGSRQIVKNYKHATLIAKKDAGQGDAVAKGIQLAKGDIIAWLNSDDSYYDTTVFETVCESFSEDDEFIYGKGVYLDEKGNKIRDAYVNSDPDSLPWRLQQECGIMQPAVFFRREAYARCGTLSMNHEFCLDYQYWIRALKKGARFKYVDKYMANAHYHLGNKTYGSRGESYKEVCSMLFEQYGYVNHVWLRRYAEFLIEGYDGVLVHPGTRKLQRRKLLEEKYIELLKCYNTSADTIALLDARAAEKGYGDTLREIVQKGLRPRHYSEVTRSEDLPQTINEYDIGGRRWRFDPGWRTSHLERARVFFEQASSLRDKNTCIVLCNGPSLNLINFDMLIGQDVIGSNNIFLKSDILNKLSYYTVVNYLVAEQSAPFINGMEGVIKIVPWWLGYCINDDENVYYVPAIGFPKFSKNLAENISWRHTVTFFNLQIAYGLGYKRVLIVGCDHNYNQDTNTQEGDVIHQEGEDLNHFDRRYFQGKKWQAADTTKMEDMYRLAKEAYEEDGREIVNCTTGGKLELFRRATLDEELDISLNGEKMTKIIEVSMDRAPLIGDFSRADRAHIDETKVVNELLWELPTGSIMVDVGAHRGSSFLPFLKKGWRVLAFEPDPHNRDRLREEFGGRAMLTIDPRAVSDKPVEGGSFYSSEESTGISSLSAFTGGHEQTATVSVTTLGHVVKEFDLPRIDFLKIDAEGYDLMVLKGVPWSDVKPQLIVCEFEDRKTTPLGYTFHDQAKFLTERGYAVFVSEWHPVIRYGIKHDWRRLASYPCQLESPDAWGNLIAFRDTPDPDTLRTVAGGHLSRDLGGTAARQTETARWPRTKEPFGFLIFRNRLIRACLHRPARALVMKWLASPTAAALVSGLALTGAGILDIAWSDWLAVTGLVLIGLVVAKEGVIWRWRRERDQTKLKEEFLQALADERSHAERELSQALADERSHAERELSQALADERSRRSLVDVHLADRKLPLRRILLLFTIHRSGSTWLFDMLRTHPAVRIEPTARVWTELGIDGWRYPGAFHDIDGAMIPLEVTPGLGAAIPAFPRALIPDIRQVDDADRWALEKAHPQFVDFNANQLAARIRDLRERGVDVEVVYGVRNPLHSMWSMAEFKIRDPNWYRNLQVEEVPQFIAKSLETLAEVHALVGGTVVEYENLPNGAVMNRLCQRFDASWGDAAVKAWLAHAVSVTERSKRQQRTDSAFLGKRGRSRDPAGPERAWLTCAADIEMANETHRRLLSADGAHRRHVPDGQ